MRKDPELRWKVLATLTSFLVIALALFPVMHVDGDVESAVDDEIEDELVRVLEAVKAKVKPDQLDLEEIEAELVRVLEQIDLRIMVSLIAAMAGAILGAIIFTIVGIIIGGLIGATVGGILGWYIGMAIGVPIGMLFGGLVGAIVGFPVGFLGASYTTYIFYPTILKHLGVPTDVIIPELMEYALKALKAPERPEYEGTPSASSKPSF